RISSMSDLESVELHADWGQNKAQFVQSVVRAGVLAQPTYWYSAAGRAWVGVWHFTGKDLAPSDPIQETTLFTLADDVTGETAFRVYNTTADELQMGVTMNLDIAKDGVSPTARLLYFESVVVAIADCKVVVECRIWDGETDIQLMTVRATYSFFPLADYARRVKKAHRGVPPPPLQASAPVPSGLPEGDLRPLDRAMSFIPSGHFTHKTGAVDEQARSLALMLDFGSNISGPPGYVHGGIIGTVLANASQLLLAKSTGLGAHIVNAPARKVSYLRGLPAEAKDAVIEARVDSADRSRIVILARLLRQGIEHTTLTTTYTLAPSASKL
ncbi:hypothetical protein H4R19_003876, partial [Coemansia spiralis]